jgi:hypothetical protein
MSTEVSTNINNTLIETLAKIENKLQLMEETELTHDVKKSELISLKNELSRFNDKLTIVLAKINAIV